MIVALILAGAAANVAPLRSPSDCDHPDRRAEILSGKAVAMPQREAIDAYNQQRSAAIDSRMAKLGMSEKEKSDFALRVMKLPEFELALRKGMSGLSEMIKDMAVIARSKDPLTNCRALVHMQSQLPSMINGAKQQWDLMDRELDAEAAKRSAGTPL